MTAWELQKYVDELTDGYAIFHPVCDDQKRIVEYNVLECNARFREDTGFSVGCVPAAQFLHVLKRCGLQDDRWLVDFLNEAMQDRVYGVTARIGESGNGKCISVYYCGEALFSIAVRSGESDSGMQNAPVYRHTNHWDELTGLFNRFYIMEGIKNWDITSMLPMAVILGDINGLKLINDAFGYQEGDRVITVIADILHSACREGDIIARWSGDEFLLLQPRTSEVGAAETIRKIRCALEAVRDWRVKPSITFGFSVKRDAGNSILTTQMEAEKWMFHKKLLEGKSYRSTVVSALLSVLYEKSAETEEHSLRLEEHCCRMGRAMQLSSEEMAELRLLSMLHDIGKVGVNQQILVKPGPLNAEEWTEIQRHCEIGYRIVRNISELSSVAQYILLHHERWDGSGYPMGYKEEQIPLLCRILSIADAYDVMTQGRVYKKAMNRKDAADELRRNAGTQFDPHVTEVFLRLLEDEVT